MPRNAPNSLKPGEMGAIICTQTERADFQSDGEYKACSNVPRMRGSISTADIDNNNHHSNNSKKTNKKFLIQLKNLLKK